MLMKIESVVRLQPFILLLFLLKVEKKVLSKEEINNFPMLYDHMQCFMTCYDLLDTFHSTV